MKLLIKFVFCLLLSPGFAALAQAETLKVTVSQSVADILPEVTARIMHALAETGYEIKLEVLPGNRALMMASEGKVAMDLYRQPAAIAEVPNLIAIEPSVGMQSFGMITSKKSPHICDVEKSDFRKMSVVGRLGIKLYEDYYYPKFGRSITVEGFEKALRIVALQRVDVSFLSESAFNRLDPELRRGLIFCNRHITDFPIKSFIHKDYLWARDKIEAAYRNEFGGG